MRQVHRFRHDTGNENGAKNGRLERAYVEVCIYCIFIMNDFKLRSRTRPGHKKKRGIHSHNNLRGEIS